jgi:hypothetical protein
VDPDLQSTDQAYVFTNDNPLNSTDPLGQCSLLSWNCWTFIAKKVVRVSVVAVELMNGNAPAAAKTLGKTIGGCLSGGAAFGIGAIGSVCAGATGNGMPFFSVTGGVGGGSPSAFLGVGGIFSNAQTPSELSKDFTYVGGSVGEGLSVGGEGAIGKAPNKKTIWVGSGSVNVGISPVPFEYHAGESWTWVG